MGYYEENKKNDKASGYDLSINNCFLKIYWPRSEVIHTFYIKNGLPRPSAIEHSGKLVSHFPTFIFNHQLLLF